MYSYRINEDRSSVFLFYNDGHAYKALSHDLVVDIIDQFIDAHLSVDELLEALVDKYESNQVQHILEQLLRDRFLIQQATGIHRDLVEQWSSAALPPLHMQHALSQMSVAIESSGIDEGRLLERLNVLGVQQSTFEEADFAVVLTDDVLAVELEAINDQAISSQTPWILAHITGQKLWLASFIPEETPCWECFAHAIRRNRAGMLWFDTEEHQLYRASQHYDSIRSLTPMAIAQLENLVLYRLFNGKFGQAAGELLLVDARSGAWDKGRPIPYSSACRCCQKRSNTFEPLKSRVKMFTQDGGHRTSDPLTAFNTYAHLIDPYVGFFRNLRRVDTGKNALVHTFMLQYCRTDTLAGSADLLRTDTGYSYGKGISEWQSKASCLFEAIERYSGQWRPNIPVVHSSFESMPHRAIHPEDLLLFSDRQYANRKTWNQTCPDKFKVFEPLDYKESIDWVATYSLNTLEKVYIPAAYGFYNYHSSGSSFAFADSNGCSAGLTKEEAILQGLFEVVERDSLALAIGHRAPFARVNLAGVTLPYFEEMASYLSSRKRTLEVFRVPSELNIPCYMALSECTEGKKAILAGYGCHLDPVIAVSRAVTELAQMLYVQEKDSHERVLHDRNREQKFHQASLIKSGAQNAEEYLVETLNQTTEDILEDIQICVKMLADKGLEVFVLDQTNPEIGCPVVKVLVPGMYQFWYRTGGKRMKDVPISEGWRQKQAFSEEDIDPVWLVV